MDKLFPNGILQFNNKISFEALFNKIDKQPASPILEIGKFKSVKEFYKKYQSQNNNYSSNPNLINGSNLTEVDSTEYIYDLKNYIFDDDVLSSLLNIDMQVIIGDTLK